MAKYTYPSIPDILIDEPSSSNLKVCVCIPCYNEHDVESTVNSLLDCRAIEGEVLIMILINDSAIDSEVIKSQNNKTYQDCIALRNIGRNREVAIHPIHISQISPKKAGVGYARRLVMDEACRRFMAIGKDRGIIACLDADTTISENYLIELVKFFETHESLTACSIAFEHELDIENTSIRSAICDYESHLRYFINMQRSIGLPFAYQTVGSAMAVTAKSYRFQGGMNTRKAGEDFYFLHKFIKNELAGELNGACVFPSARVSDRVPFGTGKAVGDIMNSGLSYQTYNVESFVEIGRLVYMIPDIYNQSYGSEVDFSKLSRPLNDYLHKELVAKKIEEIKSNTTSYNSFRKRFFQWFDAFKLMKCLHYLRDNGFPNIEISNAMESLFTRISLSWSEDKYENLKTLRMYDRR